MTREEAIRIATGLRSNFKCESGTMVDFCNTVIKALEQETVSRESYDHEYFLRKELEVKIAKLEQQKVGDKRC